TPRLPPGFPDDLRRAAVAEHPHAQAALAGGAPIVLPDTTAAALSAAEKMVVETRGLRSIAYIPLMVSDRVIGVLIIGSVNRLRTFSDEEIALYAGYSGQAAQTIENVRMYELEREHAAALEVQIAERKQAEERLRESELTYRGLLDGMNDAAWVIDFDTTILDVNQAACTVLGYAREELLVMRIAEIDVSLKLEVIQQLADRMPADTIQIFETQ